MLTEFQLLLAHKISRWFTCPIACPSTVPCGRLLLLLLLLLRSSGFA